MWWIALGDREGVGNMPNETYPLDESTTIYRFEYCESPSIQKGGLEAIGGCMVREVANEDDDSGRGLPVTGIGDFGNVRTFYF